MIFITKPKDPSRSFINRLLLIMKLVVLLILINMTAVLGDGFAQNVTLKARNIPLVQAMRSIQKQSGHAFFLNGRDLANIRVNALIENKPVANAMNELLAGKPAEWVMENGTIVVKPAPLKQTKPTRLVPEREVSLIEIIDQQRTVTGTVTDEEGQPIEGVTVAVKGSNVATTTDEKGEYSLNITSDASILVFSNVGFIPVEKVVGSQKTVDVVMVAQIDDLEEVVVVGYGVQKKSSLTAAVSNMKASEISSVPTANLSNNLGGRVSGVIVKQGSGEVGRDGSNIFVRGISTTGSTSPLLVVDGIPRSFQQLDPNAIESFTILKDAAAVAPYGVAGANGVILVTTKQGKSGKPTISYNGYVGFQNPTVLPEFVNSVEYATLKNDIARNDGLPLPYSEEALRKFADGSEPDLYSPDEVYDFILTKNSPMTYHNVEMTGGTDRIKYYGALGYTFQEGMWNTNFLNRYNLTLNVEGKVSENTIVSLNINGRVNNANYPNSDMPDIATTRIMELIGYSHPGYGPMVFSNGLYGRFAIPAIFETGYLKDYSTGIYTQMNLEQRFSFLPGLRFRGTVAYDPSFSNLKRWATPMAVATLDTSVDPYIIKPGIFGETKSSLSHNVGQAQQLTYQAGLDYVQTFSNHSITLLGLFEARKSSSWNLGASRRNFNLLIDEIDMGSSSSADATTKGTSDQASQIGLVYRAAYEYGSKYLFEASGRYDGHYYFAPDSRFGFFPSFSAGWRLSEENFLKNKVSWLDNLKLRASYGEVGALAGSPFQYLSTYSVSGPGYVLGGNAVQIISERNEPNPNITWERAKKTDVGLEFVFLKHKINLEIDYFYEKRSNMLVAPDIITPQEYGIGLSQVNAGIMENKGVDLTAGVNLEVSRDLKLLLNGTFTYAKNTLLQTFENPVTFNNPNRRRTGKPLGTQFGYKAIGFFKPEDFDIDGNLNSNIAIQPWGKVQPGDIRYEDVNGDGKIDLNDEVAIGDPNLSPRVIYGFSPSVHYKGWSIDALFQGAAKTSLYHGSAMSWAFYNGMNALKENLDYWRPDNQSAKHPRITGAPTANNTQTSSFWMRSASYLRLKNLTVSYKLNDHLVDKIGLQSARVFVSSQNLVTWTGMTNWDPESNYLTYPQQKAISFGVNLSL